MNQSNNEQIGLVVEFDHHRGLGTIESDGARYLFHCAELLDGSRDIAVGAEVSFVTVTRFGLLEASNIDKR
jgi:CspA family cold shock protein